MEGCQNNRLNANGCAAAQEGPRNGPGPRGAENLNRFRERLVCRAAAASGGTAQHMGRDRTEASVMGQDLLLASFYSAFLPSDGVIRTSIHCASGASRP